MVAVAGGSDIRCAPYYTFGTQELSGAAVAALEGRKACLLANHGVIAVGEDLPAALALAGEVENLAAQYCTGAVYIWKRPVLDRCRDGTGSRRRSPALAGKQCDATDSGLNSGGVDIPVRS